MIRRCLLLCALAILLALPVSAMAPTDEQKQTFKDSPGVLVLVSAYLDENSRALGVTDASLQTQVELNLRRNRVPVLTPEEWVDTIGSPILQVELIAASDASGLRYHLSVSYREVARLFRKPEGFGYATVWEREQWNLTRGSRDQALNGLEDYCNQFCNDFLASR
jgi:hypothetical protein